MVGASGALFWLVVSLVLFVIEGFTVQLVCLWFAFGSLFAMLASFLGAPLWVQLLVFVISSVAVLIFGRPFLNKKLIRKKQPTNADRVIGQTGVVLQEIDNVAETGRVKANGLDWMARSAAGVVIPSGATVRVRSIEGVKLIVEPVSEPYIESPNMEEEL